MDLAGEFAYGAVNFRRTAGGVAGGVVTTVGFTPSYLGRVGTPANASDTAWIAGDNLFSGPPTWYLGGTSKTYPITYAGKPLDHVGAPNFGAPSVPGLVFLQTGWSTDVTEGAGTDSYALGLNTLPTGRVIPARLAAGRRRFSGRSCMWPPMAGELRSSRWCNRRCIEARITMPCPSWMPARCWRMTAG